MAHYVIAKEVKHPVSGGWNICFQYGTYHYDSDQDTDVASETGYRFIWRRPNTQLQGARGQARLTSEWITILLGKAASAGWYPIPPRITP